jgi:Ni/Fe-hydrogenase subunit HybB-like protein
MRSASSLELRPFVTDKLLLGLTPRDYVRSLMTPGTLLAGLILVIGVPLIVYRFAFGLAATTNLSQANPWGIWIGIDVLSGVALAAGGYTLSAAVYIFGLKDYQAVVRPALLTGFLGYLFAVIGLMVDLGRPWNLPVPLVYSYGTTSVMFEVAWCVALYTMVLGMEFTPALFEWLGLNKARQAVLKLTIGATVLGVLLSTLHQSSLGALFLMAPTKLHPLWYSPFVPIFFFVSSIIAGLSMVIVESRLSHKAFRSRIDPHHEPQLDRITLGLGRAAAIVLFSYFFIKLQGVAQGGHWHLLATGWGAWFLFEIVGFVLVPCLLLAHGVRNAKLALVRWTAGWVVLGVVVNRLNVSVIAMNWNAEELYIPSAAEIITSLTIITIGVLTFRWIVNRMPILRPHPDYPDAH